MYVDVLGFATVVLLPLTDVHLNKPPNDPNQAMRTSDDNYEYPAARGPSDRYVILFHLRLFSFVHSRRTVGRNRRRSLSGPDC